MAQRQFKTLAPELSEYADRMADDSAMRGFRVKVEKHELGHPFTATLLTTRDQTTVIIEVAASLPFDRLAAWSNYGKSCGHDLRLIVAVPHGCSVSLNERHRLQVLGCGLSVVSANAVDHQIQPRDLALAVSLPPLASLPIRVRRILGPAYDQFDQAQWREGFDDACRALERGARAYLNHWIRTGRIRLITSKGVVSPPPKDVNRMTLGRLKQAFSQVSAKNHTDATVEQALTRILRDRNALTHHRTKKNTEKRLRTNVGTHMYVIIEALKAMKR